MLDKKTCILVVEQADLCLREQEDMSSCTSSCSTRGNVFSFNKKTSLLVEQENMSSCVVGTLLVRCWTIVGMLLGCCWNVVVQTQPLRTHDFYKDTFHDGSINQCQGEARDMRGPSDHLKSYVIQHAHIHTNFAEEEHAAIRTPPCCLEPPAPPRLRRKR